MKTRLYLPQTKSILITNNIEGKSLSKSISQHLARNNINKFKLAELLNFNPIKCSVCGHYNPYMSFNAEVNANNQCNIIGIDYYLGSESKNNHHCYSSNKNCALYKLNPNSFKYISLLNNISLDEAKNILHKRNSSPFYRINYSSDDEYTKAQSRSYEWFAQNNKNRDEWITKANKSRSLSGYIERFGEDLGTKKYNIVCNEKINNIENFKKRYQSDWKEKYKQYLNTSAAIGNLSDYIEVYDNVREGTKKYIEKTSSQHLCGTINNLDSLIKHCNNIVQRTRLYVCDGFPVKQHLITSNAVRHSIGIYVESYDILIKNLIEYNPSIHSEKRIKISRLVGGKGISSWHSYTNSGELLRSNFESEFYLALLQEDITSVQISKHYPTTSYISDFYIPEIDVYVEICGLMNNTDYADKINLKKQLPYNIQFCYVVKDIDTVIEYIKGKLSGL